MQVGNGLLYAVPEYVSSDRIYIQTHTCKLDNSRIRHLFLESFLYVDIYVLTTKNSTCCTKIRPHTCADSNVGGWQTLGPQLWGAGTKPH
jgi:hypothetical protein